jgi:tetratricopeptide (TPR) repeat protein
MQMVMIIAFLAALAPQDRVQDDVIELKGEGSKLVVGKVTNITDTTIELTTKDGKPMSLDITLVHPGSVYRLRAARIDPRNANEHWALGDYCKANGLYAFAAEEYDKAAAIDSKLKDKAKRAKDEMRSEDARSKFERAKRFGADKRYQDALELLKQLTERYSDTPYAEEARKESEKLAGEVAKENEAKRAELDEKKKRKDEEAAKAAENAEKLDFKRAQDFIVEARTSWNEGLDWEAKGNLTKADKAWKMSDARLAASRTLCEKLEKSNDVNMIKSAKDLERDVDAWVVRTCYRLGRLWATELTYGEAIAWLNKGLKLEPDHHLINEVLLTLTQLRMRKNAAGGGY